MSVKQYYAHLARDGRKQTVMDHLLGTAKRAASCLSGVGLEKAAYLAGLLHDLGKFTEAFQTYLEEDDQSKRGSVIHTFQGCRYFLERVPDAGNSNSFASIFTSQLLAFAVGAHHGLFDCVDECGTCGLEYRKEKENTFYQEAVDGLHSQITRKELSDYFTSAADEIGCVIERIENTYEQDDEYCFEIGLLARLLLSAVIEGDRHDTAEFMNRISAPAKSDDMRFIWRNRLCFMEEKLSRFPIDTPIAKARTAISNQCRDFADKPKGIYRLNVPTGGGKTLGSLRYALAHAEKHNLKRLIFVSPLLSILEQNAAVIREYIGDDSLILEHHSNVVLSNQTSEQLDERELLLQSWESPIVITTLVQLLNSMFGGKTSSIRRFQALCESVIVIDEVQTVPAKLLSLFNLTVRFLAEQCGATVILCSATQPYLEGASHPLLPPPKKIVPYDPEIWNAFERTKLLLLDNTRLEKLPELIRFLMEDTDSLLVICNKKEEAAYLLESTRSAEYISYHLSASMCMQHRRDAVEALKDSLIRKKTLCISTQVIEAGVDISFQRVVRLTAGMDSIVQSAGRCNRNSEADVPLPVYIVNCTDEKLGKLQDIQRGKTATILLLNAFVNAPGQFHNDLTSDEAIEYYYKAFYSDMSCEAQNFPIPKRNTTILDLLSENKKFTANSRSNLEPYVLWQAFKTAGQAFSVFEENTVDVLVPYGEGKQLIEQLCSERCKTDPVYRDALLKQATGYTVSIYDYQRHRLEGNGALLTICNGYVLALQPEYYDDHTGVLAKETNIPFLEV